MNHKAMVFRSYREAVSFSREMELYYQAACKGCLDNPKSEAWERKFWRGLDQLIQAEDFVKQWKAKMK